VALGVKSIGGPHFEFQAVLMKRKSVLRFLQAGIGAFGLTFLAGCGGSTATAPVTTSGPTLASGGAANIYVTQGNNNNQMILQFSAAANGSVSPTSTLTMPAGFTAQSVATDSAGQLYVGGIFGPILVYAAGASGAAAPVRTILGSSTSFADPRVLTVDSAGSLYVYSFVVQGGAPTVSIFSPGANGQAAPSRQIVGALTLLDYGSGIAVDRSNNLYVANAGETGPGTILVFSPTATGNVAPVRTITGPLGQTFGIDTDPAGNLYVLTYSGGSASAPTIVEFGPAATGVAVPVRTIAGANTGLGYGVGLRVDAAGNIYVCAAGTQFLPYIAGFGPSQSGNVAPATTLSSTSWNSADIHSIAVN
jgi:Beta-propeller repeat